MNLAPRRLAVSITLSLALTTFASFAMANKSLLYIASQDPEKMGISIAELDSASGSLSAPKMVAETRDPAHFSLSADGRHLYMCNTGTPGGVSAFEVTDKKSGALKFLNYRESKGRGPSYVSVDKSGRYVLDANYGGGFVEVYSLAKDGSLDAQTAFVQHVGSSADPVRQTKPYAHWIRTDPSGRFALASDLGMDEVVIYKFDEKTGKLTPNNPPFTKVAPGMGPRHLAYHPNGKWIYGIEEIANKVLAFNWDANKGTLTQFQEVNTLADDFHGTNTAAEITVRADGRFLYATNRGEDTMVVYAIDPTSGSLTFKQRASTRGKTPRYFAFDPSNHWIVVSNQDSANVTVFKVDEKTGELSATGEPVAINKPMGVVFLR